MIEEKLNVIRKNGENEYTEFKSKGFLNDSEEIAAQLVSFANRFGGKLLVGVTDDGDLEGAKINRDKALLKFVNVANDKCSPKIDFSHDFLSTKDGDVLIINIEKRKGLPHAIVSRPDYQIKSRTYYIRDGSAKRLVSDELLRYIFNHSEDPALKYDYDISIQYLRKNPKEILTTPYQTYSPVGSLFAFWNNLNIKDVSFLLEEEGTNIRSLLVELLPYAMLCDLSRHYSGSWLVNVVRRAGRTTTSYSKTDDVKEIRHDHIPLIPNNSITSRTSLNLTDVLKKNFFRLMLPANTEIIINFKKNVSTLKFIHRNFIFDFSFIGSSWIVGAGPLSSVYGVLDDFNEGYAFQQQVASVNIISRFTGTYNYPEIDESFYNYYVFGETIIDHLKYNWDWTVFIETMPEQILFSIKNYTKRILQILEKKG